MKTETKTCQNCKVQFIIEPDDFAFYEKIKVPPPTWCPECRLVRRLSFFNERSLYRGAKCELCNKEVISMHAPGSVHIYCPSCWWSDKWDPMSYGKDVDFSKPFLQQFRELIQEFPYPSLEHLHTTLQNSEYVNICSYLKNCYLIFNSDYSEDCMYGACIERSKRVFDAYMVDLSEKCYEGSNLFKDLNV